MDPTMEAARLFSELDELEGEARARFLEKIRDEQPEVFEHLNRILEIHDRDLGNDLHPRMRDRIGKYRVLDTLGEGAVGTVYKVAEAETDHVFALKLMPADQNERIALDEIRLQRAAEGTPHPNLVPIREIGRTEDGCFYFTMDWMPGGDLAALATKEETGLTTADVLRWMHQVAGALAHLHGEGIVHQDVKPANIFLDGKGNARLGDFSIALSPQTGEAALTRSIIGGSYYYMAPEQWLALTRADGSVQATPSSDVCSFGLTVYALLSGSALIGDRQSLEPLLPGERSPGKHLDAFLAGCLHPEPSERFADGSVMLAAYERVLARLDEPGSLYPENAPAHQRLLELARESCVEDGWKHYKTALKRGSTRSAARALDQLRALGVDTLPARERVREREEREAALRASFRQNLARQAFVEALGDLEELVAGSDLSAAEEVARFRDDQELAMWQRWVRHLELTLEQPDIDPLIRETHELESLEQLNELITRHEFAHTDPCGKAKAILLARYAFHRLGHAEHAAQIAEALATDTDKRRLWQKRAADAGHRESGLRLADDLHRNGHKQEARELYLKFDGRPPRSTRALATKLLPVLIPLAILLAMYLFRAAKIRELEESFRMATETKRLDLVLDVFSQLVDPWNGAEIQREQLASFILEDLVFEENPRAWGSWYTGTESLEGIVAAGKSRDRIVEKARHYEDRYALRVRNEEELVKVFGADMSPEDYAAFRERVTEKYGKRQIHEILAELDKALADREAYEAFLSSLVIVSAGSAIDPARAAIQNLPEEAPFAEGLILLLDQLAAGRATREGLAQLAVILPETTYDQEALVRLKALEQNLSPGQEDLLQVEQRLNRLVSENLSLKTTLAGLEGDLATRDREIDRIENQLRDVRALADLSKRDKEIAIGVLMNHLERRELFWEKVSKREGHDLSSLESDLETLAAHGLEPSIAGLRAGSGFVEKQRETLAGEREKARQREGSLEASARARRSGLEQVIDALDERRTIVLPPSLGTWLAEDYRAKLARVLETSVGDPEVPER